MRAPVGKVFGRLTVIETLPGRRARVRCECGQERCVSTINLGRRTFSCGCLMRERASEANRIHGLTDTKEHRSWMSAIGRCCNPSNDAFARYGGRGITMCQRWLDSFEAFLADMGPCPGGHTLDRENNDGNYEPGNCRWATPQQQANNRRSNRHIEHDGKRLSLIEWSRRLGIKRETLRYRIDKGWPIERAFARL